MEVWEAIRKKRAVRDFKPEPLQEAHIRRILDAGRRSQSSKNSQPWQFIAIQNHDTLEQLSKTGNFLTHVAGAALCVVICVPEPNDRTLWHFFDTGQSAAYMQLAALEVGVGSCLGTIYEPDTVRQLLGFPADLQARILISFGYPADQPERPPRKEGRRTWDDVIHLEHW
ncbi:MAG: nitroreductase family protein [Anaerolineae bacterium]|nr:nitroreductase family protein [Anaerolineae bacterium]